MAIELGNQPVGSTRTLTRAEDGSVIKRSILPGGLRLLSEHVPTARSATIGIWVGVGSRDESPSVAGGSHFLEHLLFKGTHRRGAFEIAAEIEEVGGDLNAFTTKECTCYHARVLADDVPLALDVLTDMVTDSLITPDDVDVERAVVLEELAMNEDDHADAAAQRLSRLMFGGCSLADPIIGSVESLNAMSPNRVRRHYLRHYRPADIAITAAGAVEHRDLVREIRRLTKGWVAGDALPTPARAMRDGRGRLRRTPANAVISRPTEQAHLMLGWPGVSRTDPRRTAIALLDTALGSGMSSRLFQHVREEKALAYTVQSFRSSFSDTGAFGVYAGTMPEKADTTIAAIHQVLDEVVTHGIGDSELARAKGQLKGSAVLDSEDNTSRVSRLGYAEVLTGIHRTLDDLLAEIDAVSVEEVAAAADFIFAKRPSAVVVGPYDESVDVFAHTRGMSA